MALRLVRRLGDPLPEPNFLASFRIRSSLGKAELAAWVRCTMLLLSPTICPGRTSGHAGAPNYDPEQSLVVVTLAGRLTAYCICQIDLQENERSLVVW